MLSAGNPRGTRHRARSRSPRDEVIDDVIERGSPAACWSALFVAAALAIALWFGDFAAEKAGPAWEAVVRSATLLRQEINLCHTPQV